MNKGITLLEVIAIVFVVGILAALLLPAVGGGRRPRQVACANNLALLWKMQNVYMSQFGGPMKAMPTATGADFWLALTKTKPPIIDPTVSDIFLCPVKGSSSMGECDYAGPAKPINQLADGDIVGADLPDNHMEGSKDEGSGFVLRKSGDVMEVTGSDWTRLTREPLFPVR